MPKKKPNPECLKNGHDWSPVITVIASGYQYIFCYRCNCIEEITPAECSISG